MKNKNINQPNYFLAIVITLLASLICIYFNLPIFNFGFSEAPKLIIVITFIWIILSNIHKRKELKLETLLKTNRISIIIIITSIFYITIIQTISTWSLFRANDYKNLIGKVEQGTVLSKYIPSISIDKIRVVDESLANILGDKVLGEQTALGSQVNIGDFTIQKVNNNLYWVAPLVHSGYFKWNKNQEGTTGYVIVNATNERDVKLIQTVNNKAIRIKYQPNAYFQDNLERHLYFNGYFTSGYTDYTFEINDSGIPFWVITKYKKQIGFGGDDATGVLVVNAENGFIQEHTISNAPSWIDRIQPEEFIENQLNDWGEFVKGYWNFSNENKLKTTEKVSLVYGEDNKSYWYTGLTSVGKDEATVGFVLVDTRTKKAVWYKQSGATENAAQTSAEGKVQEKGYWASKPIPYNIDNIPTYVMTLKDRGGLIKMYAMVAVEDYTIVGVGNTMQETLMSYKNAFNMTDSKLKVKKISQKFKVKSVINRINSDVKNGNSFYYFKIHGQNKIFVGSSQISNELPISNIGDSVEIEFDNDNEEIIGISKFNNKSLNKID